MPKSVVGKVSHFFGKIGVAALSMSGELKIGDHIRFEHRDGSLVLEDTVRSMQINHKEVPSAGPGDDVAIKLNRSVHDGNIVYKVTE